MALGDESWTEQAGSGVATVKPANVTTGILGTHPDPGIS